ncbi:carbohydrate porin [Siccirubricoccus sp. KC 17139]|uniref:Carbohydrate porin n=1 Tax=Siccirubricoccus soli TaxID=2899147 RepID=A0ABT1D8F6_9PROT|nr:carbohydrate porin [Siccirubricoccus soli]MCO6417887.1 carbohydrate porin [Siccirubricoccus soli]MCP2684022.1 carbohydrate porin [Siccirubricoccus soli]
MLPRCLFRRARVAWGLPFLLLAGLLLVPAPAEAQRGVAGPIYERNIDALIEGAEEWLAAMEERGWLLRGQMTNTLQGMPRFRAPYRGENSLSGQHDSTAMQTVDLVLGRRLWENAELVFVPSPTRGFGFADNHGLGGLTNTESFHGGTRDWDTNITRLFLRQTIDISYDAFGQDDDPMRFAGPLALERITITAGKIATWDIFDNNRYSHDPRTQFLNYALVGAGAFDIATDAAGYTHGLAVEWENGTWATRLGAFQVTRNQGGDYLDDKVTRAWQLLAELDRFWWLGRRPGALRVLLGASRTRSARYDDLTRAVRADEADTERYRAYRTKAMVALSWDQQVSDTLGVFGRLGWNDGRSQNMMVTEMDWSVAGGVSVNGWRWGRDDDTVGLAMNIGGLHAPQRKFLKAGGLGFILGDGRLSYAPEVVLEGYYDVALAPGLTAAVDAQLIFNPGYNAARGPVQVGTLRLRAAF